MIRDWTALQHSFITDLVCFSNFRDTLPIQGRRTIDGAFLWFFFQLFLKFCDFLGDAGVDDIFWVSVVV